MRTFVIVIEQAGQNFSAYAPEVPGCIATGSTEKEAQANMPNCRRNLCRVFLIR